MAEDRPDLSRIDIKRLIEHDVELRYIAQTNGGEYAGPCPFCGTGDDRFRVWPDHPDGRGRYWCRVCDRGGDAIDYLRERDRLTFPQALEELRLYEGTSSSISGRSHRQDSPARLTPVQKSNTSDHSSSPRYSRRETVARYTYVDEDGIPLFQVRRVHFYDEDGKRLDKQFYQYRWEDSQWQRGLKDTRRVIYRLPRVLAAVEAGEPIYVVEGEKCVHALEELDLTATCNPMGARKWQPEYSMLLVDADVVILPDADDDGMDHARRVADSLIGTARSIKVVSLPGLEHTATHGLDVADWLSDPAHTLDELQALVETAQPWQPLTVQTGTSADIDQTVADALPDIHSFDCPTLPIDLDIGSPDSESEGVRSGAWLDAYIDYAAQISPGTPTLFHESAGLWAASTVIARRLHVTMPFGDIYPNLCIVWIAPPVLFNKTTALNIARQLVADTVPALLVPEPATVETLFCTLAGDNPIHAGASSQRKRRGASPQHPASAGWVIDGLSSLLADTTNSAWIDSIVHLLDCPANSHVIGPAGHIEVRGAYLSMISSSAPDVLSQYLDNEKLWRDGWWPNFALLSPEEEVPYEYGMAVWTERPPALADKLAQLDNDLPERTRSALPDSVQVVIDKAAHELWEAYNKAIRFDLLVAATRGELNLDRRLYSTYGRLPVQALKVATILSVLDWSGNGKVAINHAHTQRAVRIVERWRSSTHRTLQRSTRFR